jgi:hypothetical protein
MAGNEGIQVYGGAINVGGSLATGRNASAVSVVGSARATLHELGRSDVAAELARLADAIDRDHARLADAEAAVVSLEAAARELEAPQPDRSRLAAFLGGLKAAVGTATEVATSVAGLELAIGRLF